MPRNSTVPEHNSRRKTREERKIERAEKNSVVLRDRLPAELADQSNTKSFRVFQNSTDDSWEGSVSKDTLSHIQAHDAPLTHTYGYSWTCPSESCQDDLAKDIDEMRKAVPEGVFRKILDALVLDPITNSTDRPSVEDAGGDIAYQR